MTARLHIPWAFVVAGALSAVDAAVVLALIHALDSVSQGVP
jgi:hypothetical protein